MNTTGGQKVVFKRERVSEGEKWRSDMLREWHRQQPEGFCICKLLKGWRTSHLSDVWTGDLQVIYRWTTGELQVIYRWSESMSVTVSLITKTFIKQKEKQPSLSDNMKHDTFLYFLILTLLTVNQPDQLFIRRLLRRRRGLCLCLCSVHLLPGSWRLPDKSM